MVFPKEQFIKYLKFGLVVKFPHSDFSEKDHFFIIVDHSPDKVPPMLSLISSKKNTYKRAYVTVEENEYSFFTKKSYIDCDKVYDKTLMNYMPYTKRNY
jgi:hypothetical protein